MRAVSLLLAPLAAPLFFASPADSAFLPACCVSEGSVEPEDAPPILVGAKVRRPDELALEADAEEPKPREAPLADAMAIPDKDEALPRIIVPPPPIPIVADDDAAPKRDIDNPNTEPCCGPAEAEPEDPPPVFAGANVRSPGERELVAMAEAPIPDEVATTDAIDIPLNELPELPEPAHEPIVAEGDGAPVVGGLIALSGCCQPEKSKTHPPDRHPDEDVTPPPVAAKVKNREKERLLEMAAEAPVPGEAPVVNAIGVPLYPVEEERRGVSEPAYRSATAEPTGEPPTASEPSRVTATLLLALAIVLTIGLLHRWRRRRGLREEETAPPARPLPDDLAWSGTAAAPRPEPEVVLARAKAKARELEPA